MPKYVMFQRHYNNLIPRLVKFENNKTGYYENTVKQNHEKYFPRFFKTCVDIDQEKKYILKRTNYHTKETPLITKAGILKIQTLIAQLELFEGERGRVRNIYSL